VLEKGNIQGSSVRREVELCEERTEVAPFYRHRKFSSHARYLNLGMAVAAQNSTRRHKPEARNLKSPPENSKTYINEAKCRFSDTACMLT
jgi:hypothetical protein